MDIQMYMIQKERSIFYVLKSVEQHIILLNLGHQKTIFFYESGRFNLTLWPIFFIYKQNLEKKNYLFK